MKKSIWKLASLFAGILALSLCFAGCSDDDDDDDDDSGSSSITSENLVGTWTGTATLSDVSYTFSFTLVDVWIGSNYEAGTGTVTTASGNSDKYTVLTSFSTDTYGNCESLSIKFVDDTNDYKSPKYFFTNDGNEELIGDSSLNSSEMKLALKDLAGNWTWITLTKSN